MRGIDKKKPVSFLLRDTGLFYLEDSVKDGTGSSQREKSARKRPCKQEFLQGGNPI